MTNQEPFPLTVDYEAKTAISRAWTATKERQRVWAQGFKDLAFADTTIRDATQEKESLFESHGDPTATSPQEKALVYWIIDDPTYTENSMYSVQRLILFPNKNGGVLEIAQNVRNSADGTISPIRRNFVPGKDEALVQSVLDHKLTAILPKLPKPTPAFPLNVPSITT